MTTLNPTPYADLTPDRVLDAVESLGLLTDGRLLALNSYENRVYQVGLDEDAPVIAKFYRPGRWSSAAILEEQDFTQQLAEREIPAVAPSVINGRTLHEFEGYRFSLTPRRGGRTPELDDAKVLEWIGRFIGRIHAIGAITPFAHRPTLDPDSFGVEPRDFLLAHDWIPTDLLPAYTSVVEQALIGVRACYARAGSPAYIRLHGDCHPGNLLWTDAGPHFVDFDDARMGPAVQDLWMLLSGERAEMSRQLADVLAGYEDFHEFDHRELHLIEALRTLRIIHHAAWLARRWEDPAFPAAFTWFNTQHYWQNHILQLREQIAAMEEGPLWSA
ncbi:serine/threonine protein kinase [Thiobaca trueperi]|uniref:Stress response kinase A n=1 Tax=Thiobaca trueperi TaxID=127458 RepID=A0A4R3N5C0_9GAMM|nr:serine/threonine protein kinase [Thiobaca trueperi]TCT24235.1 Ser/Thr protein kinase RdoA (MazF antagonist) [Thiobaca trueperi]